MTIDEVIKKQQTYDSLTPRQKWGGDGEPYCLYRNKLQYRSSGDKENEFFCCSEMPSCDYFMGDGRKSKCYAQYLITPPSIDRGTTQ